MKDGTATRITIQNRLGMPRKTAREKSREARRLVMRDRRAVGHQQADAAQRGQRRQRHDERRQAELHDAEAMEQADGDARSAA